MKNFIEITEAVSSLQRLSNCANHNCLIEDIRFVYDGDTNPEPTGLIVEIIKISTGAKWEIHFSRESESAIVYGVSQGLRMVTSVVEVINGKDWVKIVSSLSPTTRSIILNAFRSVQDEHGVLPSHEELKNIYAK